MIVFVIVAAAMAAIACAWIVVPLVRDRAATDIVREASNVAILRDQLAELDRDVAQGVIAREQYESARRELEQRVIEESQAAPAATSAPASTLAGSKIAIAAAIAIPIAAAALYYTLGNRGAFDETQATQSAAGGGKHELTGEQVNEMVAKLAKRMEGEPNNAEGWVVLARSYYSLGRMTEAAGAFEHATSLVPDNAELLSDYADAVGVVENRLDGKAGTLIERALKADPTYWKALALAGTAAFNRKDYAQAVSYWEKMKTTVPADSPMAQSIDSSIAEARELGGLKPATTVAAAPSASPAKTAESKPAPATPLAGASVAGEVKLGGALAGKVTPDDTVFVFARAAQGPKMPLAIVRMQVKDLPAKFAFDDSMAMSPQMKLSDQSEVVVGARVSKSGQAMPQSGDLEGLSQPVKVGTSGIAVVIDKTVP